MLQEYCWGKISMSPTAVKVIKLLMPSTMSGLSVQKNQFIFQLLLLNSKNKKNDHVFNYGKKKRKSKERENY